MNLTNAMRVIGRHKFLLILGILVAAAAALTAAVKVEGNWEPRAETTYRASTQLLVADPASVFSTRGTPQPLVDGQTPPTARDLAALTVVYAYVVSGEEVRGLVEQQAGELAEGESIVGAQRTTQPGTATNTGTYRLPILDITGEAVSPGRAEELSRTAAAVFEEIALAQQDAAGVPVDQRVQFELVRELEAVPIDGTSPALPIVAVGVGVLLAFIALIFAVDNARTTRREHPAPVTGPNRAPVPPRPAPAMTMARSAYDPPQGQDPFGTR